MVCVYVRPKVEGTATAWSLRWRKLASSIVPRVHSLCYGPIIIRNDNQQLSLVGVFLEYLFAWKSYPFSDSQQTNTLANYTTIKRDFQDQNTRNLHGPAVAEQHIVWLKVEKEKIDFLAELAVSMAVGAG